MRGSATAVIIILLMLVGIVILGWHSFNQITGAAVSPESNPNLVLISFTAFVIIVASVFLYLFFKNKFSAKTPKEFRKNLTLFFVVFILILGGLMLFAGTQLAKFAAPAQPMGESGECIGNHKPCNQYFTQSNCISHNCRWIYDKFINDYICTGTPHACPTLGEAECKQHQSAGDGCTWSLPTQYTLTVSKAGTGSGTVTGAGINCGADCSETYASGTSVTLTASAASGSVFAGWSGAGCSGTGTCNIIMDATKAVTATFNSITDTEKPKVSAVSPTTAFVGQLTTFSANAIDNVKVIKCDFYYDSVLQASAKQIGNTNTWQTEFTPQSVGTHKAQFKCYDAANNEGIGQETIITVSSQQKILYVSANPKIITIKETSTITANTLDRANGIIISFSPSFGSVSPNKCVTSNGGCSVTFSSPTQVGEAEITASASNYVEGNSTVFVILSCHECRLSTPILEPSLVRPNTEFNLTCLAQACNNALKCEALSAYIDTNTTRCSLVEWTNNGAKFKCPAVSEGQHTAVCEGVFDLTKLCENGWPECSESSNISFEAEVFPVVLAIEPLSQSGDKGDTLTYTAKITNYRGADKTFGLNISCKSGWKCQPNSTTLDIKNGKTSSVPFAITSPTTASLNDYSFSALAYDFENPEYNASTTFNYTIKICSREAPSLSTKTKHISATAGTEVSYNITVENQDDCVGRFDYSVKCPSDWECEISPKNSTIAVGDKDKILLEVISAKDVEIGNYTINFTATNIKDPTKSEKLSLVYKVIECTDIDADGYAVEGGDCGAKDCDDLDKDINPGATEICGDYVDNNCNGKIDDITEGCNKTLYQDILPKYKVGDGICDVKYGENYANSPVDCKPDSQEGVCGNNVVEAGEDCDGSKDVACPGLCTPNCKCPYLIGDGVCDSAAGETPAISPYDCKKKIGTNVWLTVVAVILAIIAGGLYYMYKRRHGLAALTVAHGVETPGEGELGPAVDTMLSQGYSPSEISQQLAAGGWSAADINNALSAAHATQVKLDALAEQYKVSVPTEEIEQAERYARKCLEMGFTAAQVRTALLSANWPSNIIDDILGKLTEKHVKSHARKAGVLKPTDDIDKLKDYIKEELDEGHTPQQIKLSLLEAGWDPNKLKDILP
ncbi:MAG: MopE-related protein [Candidatus Nanoarchaeia archaeon]